MWYLGEGMLGPLFAVFAQRVGGNILDLTWAWATYVIVTGVLVSVVGSLSDRPWFSKSKVMVAGYALNAVCTFCYLLVSSAAGLFLVQACLGIASALSGPTWNSLYSLHEDKTKSGKAWGFASGQAHLMDGIAIIIGGLIVKYASFQVLFAIMGMIQVAATILQMRILTFSRKKKRFSAKLKMEFSTAVSSS
jgi:predicted MFS family arabinose efflux permease